jgi:hypothetical protein
MNSFLRKREVSGVKAYLEYLQRALTHERPVKSLANGAAFKIGDLTEGRSLPRPFDYGTKAICSELRRKLSIHDEPVFLFANLMEAHEPYEFSVAYGDSVLSPKPRWSSKEINQFDINNADTPGNYKRYLENYRRCYRASLEYLDREITSFLDYLSQAGDDTTIIITADHGQNLGLRDDDYLIGHVGSLSEALLHVPLEVINGPPDYPEKIENLTTLLDLPSLITSIANGETPSISRGVVPAERIGQPLGQPENFEFWNRMIRCAYREDAKYIWDSLAAKEKYKLKGGDEFGAIRVDDPAAIPEWASELFEYTIDEYRSKIQKEESSTGNIKELDNVTKDRLKELGYL